MTGAGVNPRLCHPGAPVLPRVSAVPAGLRAVDIALDGLVPLDSAICAAFAGASGFVTITDLGCTALDYVIPAQSTRPDRLAWYSDPQGQGGRAVIRAAYASVGRQGAGAGLHCHGSWDTAAGARFGHLLGPRTMPEPGQVLRGWVFDGADFDRRADPETGFDLFAAIGAGVASPDAVALTLRPDEDVAETCMGLCDRLGWAQARLEGLGSLNGAGFAGGAVMRDHASEFVVRAGTVGPTRADIDIAVIDSAGAEYAGALVPGQGRVSITAELVLIRAG
ncbi:hypothetical protein [Salipiger aestuarii]|uniref:DUF296 domain-containing protein n=1 Tax=Salipiger aestuarii TaxID=568098 RepID=A0A327Y575_9RHOB|nr:hypothetical protein [Salipiger aestuarii]EIE50955.1 hypothetical protein C357_11249 [Citreicella sp. 357]RAK15607.1 hypothetical protein ATI53_102130 [Salipiger aestuarii]